MRRIINFVYDASAVLACLALVSIAGLILGQIGMRLAGAQLKSADDFAGYALVATTFLGLGPTFRRSEHIRVGLLVDRLGNRARQPVETAVLTVAIVAVAWGTWWSGRLVYDSWRFNDLSQGLIAIPIWIPQLVMPVGLGVLLIAIADDLVRIIRTGTTSYLDAKQRDDVAITFER